MTALVAPVSRPEALLDRLVDLSRADMARVDAFIRERMDSPVPVIPALAEHLITAGGKRLRPLLTVAAARVAGARGEAHLKLAAAVEFIHTATLLHDDVVDGSERRRGKVAAHLIWGSASSVLVGDFLFARAFELMVETGSLPALGILARASRVIAEGEVMQLTGAHDLHLSEDLYLEIISAKTAELFAAAAEAGATAADGAPEDIASLRDYGQKLGLAFQLVDDALDYGGISERLGKDAGDDFREGKATLPLILALARSDPRGREFWTRTIGDRVQEPDDFRKARELVLATGALKTTLDFASQYAEQAKRALQRFPSSPWREALSQLADFAVSRAA